MRNPYAIASTAFITSPETIRAMTAHRTVEDAARSQLVWLFEDQAHSGDGSDTDFIFSASIALRWIAAIVNYDIPAIAEQAET